MSNLINPDYCRIFPYAACSVALFAMFGATVYTVSSAIFLNLLCLYEVLQKFDTNIRKKSFTLLAWILVLISVLLLVPLNYLGATSLSIYVEVLFCLIALTPFSSFLSDLVFSIADEFIPKS